MGKYEAVNRIAMFKKGFEFLAQLEKNNNRDWFAVNKQEYDVIYTANKKFFQEVFLQMQKYDNLEKLHVYRIYRDIRFSKDKTPYKNNFGAGFSRTKPMLRGGYYIHLEPGNSFVGGGFWSPEKGDLFRIRKEFEMEELPIRKIISNPVFKKYFDTLTGEELKTVPKGFDKNDPSIDLIRKKQFVVMRPFADKEVFSPDFQKEIMDTFLAMRPFFDYMSEVLTTDLNGESLF